MDKDANWHGATCSIAADPQPVLEEAGEELNAGKLSRRNFLKLGVGALSTLALMEAGGAGFLFLRSRSLEGKYGGVVTAGLLEDLPAGSVTEFSDNHFFLICAPDGGLLAVHNRCTHLGCTVNWVPEKEKFVCPCHAATFDSWGNHENPPVPRPLDTFKIQIDDGKVLVDTSLPLKRERFAPEQLAYGPAGRLSGGSTPASVGDSESPEG